jgi:hypothetical protein
MMTHPDLPREVEGVVVTGVSAGAAGAATASSSRTGPTTVCVRNGQNTLISVLLDTAGDPGARIVERWGLTGRHPEG